MENKEKNSVSELMETTMTKIREMVDSNSVIGEPITTPDGVTLIPVSRVSLGFGSGGGTYGQTSERFGGGGGAGVKIDPVAFLVIKDGQTRMMPVAAPCVVINRRALRHRRWTACWRWHRSSSTASRASSTRKRKRKNLCKSGHTEVIL